MCLEDRTSTRRMRLAFKKSYQNIFPDFGRRARRVQISAETPNSGHIQKNLFAYSLLLRLPYQHQLLSSRDHVVRLDQELLHRRILDICLSPDSDLQFHSLQYSHNLVRAELLAFRDFDFPHVGVQGSLNDTDFRIYVILVSGRRRINSDQTYRSTEPRPCPWGSGWLLSLSATSPSSPSPASPSPPAPCAVSPVSLQPHP